jgi:hypothetical protein
MVSGTSPLDHRCRLLHAPPVRLPDQERAYDVFSLGDIGDVGDGVRHVL